MNYKFLWFAFLLSFCWLMAQAPDTDDFDMESDELEVQQEPAKPAEEAPATCPQCPQPEEKPCATCPTCKRAIKAKDTEVSHTFFVEVDGVTFKITLKGGPEAMQQVLEKEIRLREQWIEMHQNLEKARQNLDAIKKELNLEGPNLGKMYHKWVKHNKKALAHHQKMLKKAQKALEKVKIIIPGRLVSFLILDAETKQPVLADKVLINGNPASAETKYQPGTKIQYEIHAKGYEIFKGESIVGIGNDIFVIVVTLTKQPEAQGFKTRKDFETDEAYGAYIKATLQVKMRVLALADHGKVTKGMTGTYYGTNDGMPPCFVIWDKELNSDVVWVEGAPEDKKSHAYWVEWYEVEIIPDFKTRTNFETDEAYAKYMESVLKPQMRVRAIVDYEKVKKGMTGTYYGTTPGDPPCFVIWDEDLHSDVTWFDGAPTDKRSHAYWVFWHQMEIVSGEVPAEKPVEQPVAAGFKSRKDFETDEAYGEYVKATLKPKMRVVAIMDYEKVTKGMTGTYYGTNDATPPCFVIWDKDLGTDVVWVDGAPEDKKSYAYWVYWYQVEIIGDVSAFKVRKDFETDEAYAKYVESVLKAQMRVRAIVDYEKVKKGMTGTYYGTTPGDPP